MANDTTEQTPGEAQATRKAMLRPYDFRRPSQISRDDLRQLVAYCEQFSRRASVTLSSDLSALASVVPPDSIEQCTYEEFAAGLENPGHVVVLALRPGHGAAVLYLSSKVALTLVERKMGGPGSPEQRRRSLTDIEVGVLAELVNMLVHDLTQSIAPLVSVTGTVSRTESNPQLVQAVPATDVVTLLRFTLRFGALSDEVVFCLPASFWQEVFKGRPTEDGPALTEAQRRAQSTLERRLLDTPVEVRLRFDGIQVSVPDVAQLAVGDELPLNAHEGDQLIVDVAGCPTFLATWVTEGRRDAFQVTEIHPSNPERRARAASLEV